MDQGGGKDPGIGVVAFLSSHKHCFLELAVTSMESPVPLTVCGKERGLMGGEHCPCRKESPVFIKIAGMVTIKENCLGGPWVLLAFDSKLPFPSALRLRSIPLAFWFAIPPRVPTPTV